MPRPSHLQKLSVRTSPTAPPNILLTSPLLLPLRALLGASTTASSVAATGCTGEAGVGDSTSGGPMTRAGAGRQKYEE